MKFTVVVPLYNKEKYITRTIYSVLNQIHKDFELIVVDDGSTDSGSVEVSKINDPRIKLIRQSNSGVSSARNRGINEAKYDYIGFLDADDAWKPNFLETINKLIEKYSRAGAYATSYEIRRDDSDVVLPMSVLNIKKGWEGIIDDYFKLSLKSPLISASSVVIPKRAFDHLGAFSVELTRGEDLDMWCRIALNYDIAFSNKVCSTYFMDSENRACSKKVNLSYTFANYAEDILLKQKGFGNTSIYFEEYMIKEIFIKSRLYIADNKRKEARELLFKYKYTRYNKKALAKTYMLSWIIKPILNMAFNIKGEIRIK